MGQRGTRRPLLSLGCKLYLNMAARIGEGGLYKAKEEEERTWGETSPNRDLVEALTERGRPDGIAQRSHA